MLKDCGIHWLFLINIYVFCMNILVSLSIWFHLPFSFTCNSIPLAIQFYIQFHWWFSCIHLNSITFNCIENSLAFEKTNLYAKFTFCHIWIILVENSCLVDLYHILRKTMFFAIFLYLNFLLTNIQFMESKTLSELEIPLLLLL